jgi:hypothetical protein
MKRRKKALPVGPSSAHHKRFSLGTCTLDSNPSGTPAMEQVAAPILALAVGHNDFPPRLDIALDETVAVGNSLRLQAAGDAAFLYKIFDQLHVISGREAADKQAAIPGLSAIIAPAQTFFRARIENGSAFSPWSNIIKHGDSIAPAITSSANLVYAEGVPLAHQLTANKVVSWSVTGGTDASRCI